MEGYRSKLKVIAAIEGARLIDGHEVRMCKLKNKSDCN